MGLIPYRGRHASGAENDPLAGRQSHASIVPDAPRPATAGEVAHVSLSLKNDNAETIHCALCATDLIGVSGHRIPASHLRVSPNPASIPVGGSTDVQIEIRVPSGTPAGRFTGLLQSDDGESVRALVQLTVGIDGPSSFSVLPAPQASRDLRPPFLYTLERLAQVQAFLAQGDVIGPTPDGLRINFLITGGRIVGERFNATVEGGGADALRVRRDVYCNR